MNAKTQDGCQLLHLAAAQGHEQVVDWLLEQGANIHQANLAGQTSLHIAAAKGHLATVKELIYRGASVHLQDQQGSTPLHLSSQHGHTAVSTTLVKKGASVTALDHRKRSPLFMAMQQGHVDLIDQSSSVYTAQQHTQHITHQIFLQKDLLPEQTRTVAPLKVFLKEYPSTLEPEEVESFTKLIAPLLIEKLSTEDIRLQEKVISYLQEGGQLYPGVLKNCPVSHWIEESLLLDIGREALLAGNEFLFQQLQEQLHVLSKHAKPGELEKLLLILRQKRLMEPFQLDTLLEVLQFATVLPMPLALETLAITNFNWQLHWKSAWLYKQLPDGRLEDRQRDTLQHCLLHLPWSPAITLRFLEGLQGQQAMASRDDFLAFVTKYEVPESLLIMAMHQPPSYTLNQLQAWKLYIACELLKNKLVSVFPGHVKPLHDKLAFLLGHGCAYESIDSLLTHLQGASQASTTENVATHLLDALDLLVEYRPSVEVCEKVWKLLEAEKDLSSQNQSIDHTIHQLLVDSTFLPAHERSIEEINDYIAEKAPGVHFVGDVQALDNSYQEVEDAYQGGSKLIKTSWKPIKHWDRRQITKWAKNFRKQLAQGNPQPVKQAEIVAVFKRAVYLQYQYHPRDTQIMSLLSFLNPAKNQGRLLQINTGEGKSLIVAMLAAIHALQGKKVDVVTSSSELSIPEVAKQQDFLAMFGLTVGENSKYDAKKEVYQRDIVYGTAGDFQGDILRTEFSGDDIRADRGFGVVIVDEVDNLLFDSRSHRVMLSSPTPGMHHLEPVLAAVWSYVNMLANHLIERNGKTYFITEDYKIEGNQITLFSSTPLEACMFEVKNKEKFLPERAENHLRQTLRTLNTEERQERATLESLQERITLLGQEIRTLQQETCEPVKESAREKNNKKKLQKIADKELDKTAKEQLCEQFQQEIAKTAWKKNQRDEIIEIPRHLQDFVRHQLYYWIENAIAALSHQKEIHYDVQNGKIVPIDHANTGVLQHNTVWSDGLAQMLQIKEGLQLEPENLSNNFISTVGYFKRYGSSIYGMTGTLGNQHTHQFFKELYGVDMATIPPYKLRLIQNNESSAYVCKELPAIIASTEQEWIEAILRTTLQKVKQNRAVLVLCQYIDQVKQLEKILRAQYDTNRIFTYTGQTSFDKHDIEDGEIILATNISGRGTDIKTSDSIERNGGMHVCMTFLPTNYRVELQNAGRTGREGKKGTAQLVLYEPEQGHSMEYLRARRDVKEAKEITAAMDEVAEMCFKDQLFTKFCALENEFFPSASEETKIEQSKILATAWEKFSKKTLSSEIIVAAYRAKITAFVLAKISEWKKNPSGDLSATELTKWEEQARKELPAEAFKKQYEQKLLDDFCQAVKAHISADVLVSFQEQKPYTPNHVSYAIKEGWGKHERKALEERWGFWLHQIGHERHLANQEILQEFDKFSNQIRSDAHANRLVKNPYFYLLKGNDSLRQKYYGDAIETYDQAISLDPLFSANARHNKVQAILRQKKNKPYHTAAQTELEKTLILLANIHKPAILGTHSMTSLGSPKPKLAEHLQHQINILSVQENHIMTALGVVKKALAKDWEIKKIKKKDLKDLKEVFEDEPVSHQKAINKAKTNGLLQLFTITEKKPTPWWSICSVALIGLAQVAAGVIITACTGMVSGLIQEGISDLITAAKAAWNGKFSWAEWGLQKAISFAVSLISTGFAKLKEVFNKTVSNVGQLATTELGSQGLKLATQQVGLALGKGIAKECMMGLVNYTLDQTLMKGIEKEIASKVSEEITEALSKNILVQRALQLDQKNGNNYWQQLLIKEGMERLIKEENKWVTFFSEVGKGVASNKIEYAADLLKGAAALKAMGELLLYTKFFLKDWQDTIQTNYCAQIQEAEKQHALVATQQQKELAQASHQQQVVTTSLTSHSQPSFSIGPRAEGYTTKQDEQSELSKDFHSQAPSTQERIQKAFAGHITGKITNSVQKDIVQATTNMGVNWTVEKVAKEATDSVNKATAELHDTVHIYYLDDQLSKGTGGTSKKKQPTQEPKKGPKDDKEQQASKQGVDLPLDPKLEAHLNQMAAGKEADVTALGGISQKAKRPIYVYNKEGKLVRILGKGLKGEPMHVQHVKNKDGSGHWQLPGGKGNSSKVVESGVNNCLYDICTAQMTPEERAAAKIQTGEDLRQQTISVLRDNPEIAKDLFQTSEQLKWRNQDALMSGGREFRVNRTGVLNPKTGLYGFKDGHSIIQVGGKGGEETDYFYIGDMEENGVFKEDESLKIDGIERGEGQIHSFRIMQDNDKKGVGSSFIALDKEGKEVKGYVVENYNTLAPTGKYKLILSKARPGFENIKLNYPNNYVFYNNSLGVPFSRSFTIHDGNFYNNSSACLLPTKNLCVVTEKTFDSKLVNRNDRRNTLGGKDSNPKREELENNIIKPSGEINPLVEWNIHDSRKKEEPTNKKDEENKDE